MARYHRNQLVTDTELRAHYEAVYKALNEFQPLPGTNDWVAVRLAALALVLDNPPDQL